MQLASPLGIGSNMRAWYAASIGEFRAAAPNEILGGLARNGSFALLETQRDAWLAQIDFLKSQLDGFSGAIFFEFSIPRMGRRIDTVLLIDGIVFAF